MQLPASENAGGTPLPGQNVRPRSNVHGLFPKFRKEPPSPVASYLDKWLAHIKPQVSPKTFERYASIVRANIKPALGLILLTKLHPMQVSAAYASALAKLAPRTVHHFHRVLSQALKQAVRWRLLLRNPCDDCDSPKVERREMQV
jgi:Phage integrase, N-terminal SAM-like domain